MEANLPLSSREQEVAALVLEGKSNKMIAASLHISIRTVEFHLKNIYAKHQVGSRTELILKLGQSTVADQGAAADNRDMRSARHWAASLREAVSKIGKELRMESSLDSDTRGGENGLSFTQSIRVCLTKYAEFNGRASRPEFWWFALFVTLAASALAQIHEIASSVFLIAVLLPFLAAGARRLRDSGKSAWWQLFLLVPVGGIVVLGFLWAMPPAGPLPEEPLMV